MNPLRLVTRLTAIGFAATAILSSCQQEKRNYVANITDPSKTPTMTTTGVSTFISDSGYTRYHITADRWRAALGMQYTPNPRGNYLQRIQYRLGTFYNHDYLMIRGNNLREYGLTAGFGLPVPGFKSVVNIGLEWKNRQCHPVALIKENYLNITVGINFNEMWFQKNKIY